MNAGQIVVTGGAGFLGRNIVQILRRNGHEAIVAPRSKDVDLTRQTETERFFEEVRPSIVIHAAAEVGGIEANARRPGRFFYANAAMGINVIESARLNGCQKLVYIGTVASYPAEATIPYIEDRLFDGRPTGTSDSYGVAKRSIVAMLDGYRREYGFDSTYLLLTNLYGPGDNFDPVSSHVVAALVRRFHDAAAAAPQSTVEVWGDGSATRDFLHVRDAARAAILAIEAQGDTGPINVGSGTETSISELAEIIAECAGFAGAVSWRDERLVGPRRRCVDTAKAERLLGFQAEIELRDGLAETVEWWESQAGAQ